MKRELLSHIERVEARKRATKGTEGTSGVLFPLRKVRIGTVRGWA